MSLSTSVTLGFPPIVTCREKDFQRERELCDNLYELYVFEGWYDSFLSFGLI